MSRPRSTSALLAALGLAAIALVAFARPAAAQIVPPTSQNQAFMEDDMRDYVASVLDLPETEAAAKLEALIRCYDPCISCATHFLRLEIDRE